MTNPTSVALPDPAGHWMQDVHFALADGTTVFVQLANNDIMRIDPCVGDHVVRFTPMLRSLYAQHLEGVRATDLCRVNTATDFSRYGHEATGYVRRDAIEIAFDNRLQFFGFSGDHTASVTAFACSQFNFLETQWRQAVAARARRTDASWETIAPRPGERVIVRVQTGNMFAISRSANTAELTVVNVFDCQSRVSIGEEYVAAVAHDSGRSTLLIDYGDSVMMHPGVIEFETTRIGSPVTPLSSHYATSLYRIVEQQFGVSLFSAPSSAPPGMTFGR